MADLRSVARQLLPPALWNLLVKLKHAGEPPAWEYLADGWADAERRRREKRSGLHRNPLDHAGWNDPSILEVYRRKWPTFQRLMAGTGPLGIAHESELTTDVDVLGHNLIMAFGYVLGLAAAGRPAISMLDWGGGIGHYCLFARALLPSVAVEYHCKDVPLLADYGSQVLPEQHFHTDSTCLSRRYDLVMASTSLHYSQDWQADLAGLAGASGRYLYLASTPIVLHAQSFVFIQRPFSFGYQTEYLGWCLNRQEVIDAAATHGMRLVREFVYGHAPIIEKAPEQNLYRGFLFESSHQI